MDLIAFLLISIALCLMLIYINCYFKRPLNYPPGKKKQVLFHGMVFNVFDLQVLCGFCRLLVMLNN